jgi:hypothetical protein
MKTHPERAKGLRSAFFRRSGFAQRGVSVTEFVIITPIALLLMLSILQFGLAYMAKLTLNNATFMAARHGAVRNADTQQIYESLIKGLLPFYVNATGGQPDADRMLEAWARARADAVVFTRLERISPSNEAFNGFALEREGQRVIPNDNLEHRLSDTGNMRTGPEGRRISIRDANVLKIEVKYGYQLKVPLINTIMRKVMCLGQAGGGSVDAWMARNVAGLDPSNCAYYLFGRIPLVATATVHMQSDAHETVAVVGGSGGSGSGAGGGGSPGGGTPGGGGEGGGNGEVPCF